MGRQAGAAAVCLSLWGCGCLGAVAQRTPIASRTEQALQSSEARDAGALPGSQPLTLTLRLAPSPAQTSALDGLLEKQTDRTSAEYHRWLTPQAFASEFGANEQVVIRLRTSLAAYGLSLNELSLSGTRLTVSGTAAQVQQAFAVDLRRMATDKGMFFASRGAPTLPDDLAAMVASIAGLDDLSSALNGRLDFIQDDADGRSAAGTPGVLSEPGVLREPDVLRELESAIEANLSPVLTLSSSLCSADLAASERDNLRALLRQAQAQGMTILVAGSCGDSSAPPFPAALAAVTAVTLAPDAAVAVAAAGVDPRPRWQAATGLPVDGLRHAPDFTTPSLAALADIVRTLVRQNGDRVGNLSPTLYTLAKAPGLFAQPEEAKSEEAKSEEAKSEEVKSAEAKSEEVKSASASSVGDWQAASGLGAIDLKALLKLYPRTTAPIATTTSLVSSTYALKYGDSLTLTSTVQPASYGAASPSGAVTFSSTSQGVLGSASINSSGTATLTPEVLPVGTYTLTATYSGDASYAGSSSTSTVILTISIVNAKVTATVSPQLNIPYGATATVTATVALPEARATPSGLVSAQIEGVTGALYTAMLSPNAGGNTATANIVVSMPPPGTYTVQVSCQGNSNYQCQSPANLTVATVKGNTMTSVAVSPAAPQAGQPISLIATVANAGNGSGTYTFTGTVTFYDSGKLLATVPVATNQATTTVTLSGNRTHNIIALYSGDSNWTTSTSGAAAVSPMILPDLLNITSNVADGTSLAGVSIIFTGTATTTVTYGVGPTGTITFFDTFEGAVVQLGTAASMAPNGPTASIGLFSTTGLLAGTHHIYAQYSGDDNYAPSISPVLALTLSDFSLSLTPTSLDIAQGKSQAVTVLVGASGGFTGTVSLGCLPPASSEATCSFAPSSTTGGGSTVLTIATTAASAAAQQSFRRQPGLPTAWIGGSSLAALLFLVLPRRRQSLPWLLAFLLTTSMVMGTLGCGLGTQSSSNGGSSGTSNGGSSGGDPGTPLGTQNFTITAAASDGVNIVRHTYQYQVTVQ